MVTKQTVHFAILDGTEIVYLERLSVSDARGPSTRRGGRLPAYCTALGKSILAFSDVEVVERVVAAGMHAMTPNTHTTRAMLRADLRRIREAGVAFDREEYAAGVWCVGAPVFNRESKPVASVSVVSAQGPRSLDPLVPAVRATSLALARRIQTMPDSFWAGDAME